MYEYNGQSFEQNIDIITWLNEYLLDSYLYL